MSRGGHVTDWHFDFMENFTFQLQGRYAASHITVFQSFFVLPLFSLLCHGVL